MYGVHIFKKSKRRKGEEALGVRNEETSKQSEKRDQGRTGDIVGQRSVTQRNSSLFERKSGGY